MPTLAEAPAEQVAVEQLRLIETREAVEALPKNLRPSWFARSVTAAGWAQLARLSTSVDRGMVFGFVSCVAAVGAGCTLTNGQIADALGADPRSVRRMIRALVASEALASDTRSRVRVLTVGAFVTYWAPAHTGPTPPPPTGTAEGTNQPLRGDKSTPL